MLDLPLTIVAEQVSEFFFFGLQICGGALSYYGLAGNALDYPNSGGLESCYFLRIIREEPDLGDTERSENSGRQFELTMIGFEAKFLVRFHGVESLILQLISLKLSNQTYASALLLFIQQNPRAGFSDHLQRQFELLAAIAAKRVKNVSGQTLRMNAHQRRLRMKITHYESDGGLRPARLGIAFATLESENAKVPKFRWKIRFRSLESPGFSCRGIHSIIIAIDSC